MLIHSHICPTHSLSILPPLPITNVLLTCSFRCPADWRIVSVNHKDIREGMNNRQQGNLSSPCYWSLILSQKGSCFGLVSLFCNSEFKLYLLAQVGEQRLHIFALEKRINWKISFSPIGRSWTPQTWPGSLCSSSYWTAPVRTKK